jgi:hypothetical protein
MLHWKPSEEEYTTMLEELIGTAEELERRTNQIMERL